MTWTEFIQSFFEMFSCFDLDTYTFVDSARFPDILVWLYKSSQSIENIHGREAFLIPSFYAEDSKNTRHGFRGRLLRTSIAPPCAVVQIVFLFSTYHALNLAPSGTSLACVAITRCPIFFSQLFPSVYSGRPPEEHSNTFPMFDIDH